MEAADGLGAGAVRSCRRLAQTLMTAAWSSFWTARICGDLSAVIATERASFGSFLFVDEVANNHTHAASFGWTSTTRSPAATSCWESR